MKVVNVEIIVVGAPWRELVYVEVTTESGYRGLGEVRILNKTDVLISCVEELAQRHLIGREASDLSALHWDVQVADYSVPGEIVQSALAALDVACWDIMGQALEVPVWKLLGGRFRNSVPAYANAWYQGDRVISLIAERAAQVVARGYRGLKIDPFGAASAEISYRDRREAVELLTAIRDAVGPEVELFVEMHGRFTASTALRIADEIAAIEPAWIEEPVPPGDLNGYRNVRQGTNIPIATGERIHTARELIPYVEEGLVDVLQVDLTHHGGITGLQRLIGWADAYNVLIAPHNVCGPIGTAAALHVGVACSNFKILEHFNDFADAWVLDTVRGAPRVDDAGSFTVPTASGLGLQIDREVCARHPRTGGRLDLFASGWERREAPRG